MDLHRRPITFDALEVESGEVRTARMWQPDRERFRRWLRDDVTERAHGAFAADGQDAVLVLRPAPTAAR